MWLMTKIGFFSIVKKDENSFAVRSRETNDIINLVSLLEISSDRISESERADYKSRIMVNQEELNKIFQLMAETITYDNFKNEIDSNPDQEHKPYHTIWSVLAQALGAYGKGPSVT